MFPEELRGSVDSVIRAIREKDFGLHNFILPALRIVTYLFDSGLIGGKPTFGAAGDAGDASTYTEDDLANLLEASLEDPGRAGRYGASARADVGAGLPATIMASLLLRLLSRLLDRK